MQFIDIISTERVNSGRQMELDVLKGVAIFLMVLCHCSMFFFVDNPNDTYKYLTVWF
jgi:uncharacterized membrane protein